MKSHQEFYCILSVSEIKEMLKRAKENQKRNHKTKDSHTVSLRLFGARCPEECIVDGKHQINWVGGMI